MCVVIPLAAQLAMTAGSGLVSYIGQRQQAAQQEQYDNAVYAQQSAEALANAEYQNRQVQRNNEYIQQNFTNVQQALQTDQEALVAQERQQSLATAQEIQQRRIERLRATGAIQASERSGLTLETLMGDFARQGAIADNTTNQNLAFASEQRVREGQKLVSVAQSRVNEARPYEAAPFQTPYAPAPVERPSLLGAALGVASGVAGGLQQRTVYDASRGRYVIDNARRLPTQLPANRRVVRDYTNGFSKNTTINPSTGLK